LPPLLSLILPVGLVLFSSPSSGQHAHAERKMNIDLTDREMQLLIDCIGTNIETVKRRHDPLDSMVSELLTELADLDMDFREALHRQDDEWSNPEDPDLHMDPVDFAAKHDREGETFMVAEDDFIQRGIDAREKAKANSRAASRRALNFRADKTNDEKSEMQQVDVWAKPTNDPADW
jgi:hypothetical protein